MKKRLSFTVLLTLIALAVSAQVTIGSDVIPEKAALLDIKTKTGGAGDASSDGGGLLMPRVSISDLSVLGIFSEVSGLDDAAEKLKHKGLTVYNIGTTGVEAGIYVWDGSKWEKAGVRNAVNFFYMPSIEIDLSVTPPAEGIDLYAKYQQQFQSPKAASEPSRTLPIFGRSDLYYYVTDYDDAIFATVSVTATGVMTYTLQATLPSDACCSYINIVFEVK